MISAKLISAKRWSILAVPAVALAVLVGPTAASPATTASSTLVIGQTSPPDSLDPQNSQNANSFVAWQLSYECLLRADPSGAVHPWLATRYTQSTDRLTYTFTLRKGVRFHNGATLTANDVVYTFERLLKTGLPYAKARFPTLESVTALGSSRVQFTLSAPQAGFLLAMGDPFTVACAILSAKAASANLATTMVGTGPFQVVSYSPVQKLELKAFKGYWGKKPHFSNLRIIYMPDTSAQLVALTAGKIDLIFPDASLVKALKAADKTIGIGSVAGVLRSGFDFNVTSGPLSNVNVRRAIELAIDKKGAVLGATLGYGTPATYFSAPYQTWAPKPSDYAYTGKHDIARAKQMLADAGYPNGFQLTYVAWAGYSPATDRWAQVLKSQLAQIGIDVTIDSVETTTFVTRLANAGYNLIQTTYVYYADPLQYIAPRIGRNGPVPANISQLVTAAQNAPTVKEYLARIRELAIAEDATGFPSVPVYAPTQFVAYRRAKVHNVKLPFSGSWLFLMDVTVS